MLVMEFELTNPILLSCVVELCLRRWNETRLFLRANPKNMEAKNKLYQKKMLASFDREAIAVLV